MRPEGIIFGGWTMGEWHWTNVTGDDAIAAAQKAAECGISWFDTAPVYGFGLGEERMGVALQPFRGQVKVMTKFGLCWDGNGTPFFQTTFRGRNIDVGRNVSPELIEAECDASLRRLKVDRIDLYQLHWWDEVTPLADVGEVLERLKGKGKIADWGVCNLNTGLLHELVSAGFAPATLQFGFNLLNRKPERNVIPYCRKHNIQFLAYSPLARGLLTGTVKPESEFDDEDSRRFWKIERIQTVNRKLDRIREIARRLDITLTGLVLAWTCSHEGVGGVIAGARTQVQAEENARANSLTVPLNEWDEISRIFC